MKVFFKNVLANIVAILLVGGLFFVIFLFMIIISAASGKQTVAVKQNSILTLNEKLIIIDSPTEDQEELFNFGNKDHKVLVYTIVEAIKKAKTDDKIKGISIENDFIQAGITQIDDIRAALNDFKKSGKFVYAYGNVVSQNSYYLGSVADQYFLNPAGGIELKGMSTEVMYLKSFAEKYGIGTEIIRHGQFKAAVEPYLRDDMSPENKEQLSTLLNDIWSKTSSKIAQSRNLNPDELKTVVDSLYAIIPENNIKYKLADQLVQKSEYNNVLKNKLKLKSDDDLNKIPLYHYINATEEDDKTGDEIAVLYASGKIMNGEGYNDVYAKNYVKLIKELAEDEEVKAVVLRVNSPGGSANASDEILYELKQLKTKKPVTVSFGDYAASGGYYIAMGADKIFSEENTITGSIGVFGMIPYFKELANRNGVTSHAVNTNANSNMYSPINGLTPGGRAILTKNVENTYQKFVNYVKTNRKKSFEEIDAVGGGRVWSGSKALSIGLVDELGSLHDAVNYTAKKLNLKKYSVHSYPKKVSKFEQLFQDMEDDIITEKILEKKLGKDKFKMYQQMTKQEDQITIQMELPYSLKIN